MKKTYLILATFFALLIFLQITRPHFIITARAKVVDLAGLPLKITIKPIKAAYNLATFKNRYEKKIFLLERQVDFLKKEAVANQEILKENQRLREALSFKTRIPAKTIAAEMIARDPSGLDSFIIIDKGRRDGITLGMTVAKEEGFVGRIFETGDFTSKVMLMDDPNSKIGAVVQRTREQGVLVGLGAGFCKLIYLSHASDIKTGDIIVAGPSNNILPKGILIGEVIKVVKDPSSLYASAVIKPSCDLFKVEEVLCIE